MKVNKEKRNDKFVRESNAKERNAGNEEIPSDSRTNLQFASAISLV